MQIWCMISKQKYCSPRIYKAAYRIYEASVMLSGLVIALLLMEERKKANLNQHLYIVIYVSIYLH